MSKKITIITANYYPEDTAIGFYTTQFSKYLVSKGYTINIVTGFPYYPQWEIYSDFKDKETYLKDSLDNITIYRSKQFVPNHPSFLKRIKMIFSFVSGCFKNIKYIKETNLVIVIVPFTFSIIPAYFLSKKTKSKLWIHIQDFEFDLAFETGILSKKNIFTFLFKKSVLKLESILLNKATIISSISENMINQVVRRTKNRPVYYFPNWISDKQMIVNSFDVHHYFNKNKFSLLYSGNIGDKQNWFLLEQLCEIIPNNTNIEIIIVGNGGYLNSLKQKLEKYSFVKFKALVPLNELGNLLTSADMHFLFQKTDVVDSVMPSKILGMMASGKPCLITGNKNSEVAKIFRSNNVGVFSYDPIPEKIYNEILSIIKDNNKGIHFGQNAKEFIWKNYSEEEVLCNFENKIEEILNE